MNKVFRKIIVAVLSIIMLFSFSMFAVACQKQAPSESDEKNQFTLNYHLKSISLFETLQLKVQNFDDVTWTSDNQAVASVVDGLVTANAYGTANITATSGNDSDTCIINVLDEGKVPSIRTDVDDDGFNLLVGDTYQLNCRVRFNNSTFTDGSFNFVSSDSETISVDANGLVRANKLGDAVIIVTGSWRNFDSIYLVKEIPVSVNPDLSMTLSIKDSKIYTMAGEIEGVTYSNKTSLSHQIVLEGQDVTESASVNWVVSDTDIVSIDENLDVTASGRGTTEIHYEYTIDGKTYKSLPVSVTVDAPKKTVNELVIYEIGDEDYIPASLLEGDVVALGFKSADFTEKAEFKDVGIFINEQTQLGFKGKEISFTVDTTLYSYLVNVIFVTQDIATADDFVSFLNSYSGNKSNVDANMTNTYYAVLSNDIDLNGVSIPSKKYNDDRFFGVFNGLGHALINATVNSTGGIFGGLHNGTIENFALIDATVTNTYSSYALLAGYMYPGATVRNVYVSASVNLLTFFRGLFYNNTNGNISNVIVDFNYGSINTATNKFVFGISAKGGMLNTPSQIYAIGNATAYSGVSNGLDVEDASAEYDVEIQGTMYSNIDEFYKAKKSEFTAENGFSKYWKATEGSLWFGDTMLYMDPEYLEDVEYVETWIYDENNMTVYSTNEDGSPKVQSNWRIKETVTIDLANMLKATPLSVKCDNLSYIVTDGKITINPANYINGNSYVFIVECVDKTYYQPLLFVSQYIEENNDFRNFLKPNSGTSSLVTKTWYAVLANDLDFSKETAALTEMGQGTRFYGTIDGQGHYISNLTIDQALFGYNFGTIKNIALVNVICTNSGKNYGLSYGAFDSQTGVISNVYMSINATNDAAYRGVIDQIYGVKLENCVFDVNYSSSNTAEITYAINGAASSASSNLANVYFLGNADQIQPGDTTKPYVDGEFAEYVSSGTVITAVNGFNTSWKVVTENGITTVYFGSLVVDSYKSIA